MVRSGRSPAGLAEQFAPYGALVPIMTRYPPLIRFPALKWQRSLSYHRSSNFFETCSGHRSGGSLNDVPLRLGALLPITIFNIFCYPWEN
jgi:hypothetical protein